MNAFCQAQRDYAELFIPFKLIWGKDMAQQIKVD